MDFMTSALILSWVAILLLALVVSGLIRQVHQLSKTGVRPTARPGVAAGATAPATDLLDESGGVLLFLSPTCRVCTEVLDEAGQWAESTGIDPSRIHAVYADNATQHPVIPVSGERGDLFERYDIIVTPYAVVIDDSATVVRSEPVGSRQTVRQLLESNLSRPRSSS